MSRAVATSCLLDIAKDPFAVLLGARRGVHRGGPDPRDLMPVSAMLTPGEVAGASYEALLACWERLDRVRRPLFIGGHPLLRGADLLVAGPVLENRAGTYGWQACVAVRRPDSSADGENAAQFAALAAHGPIRHRQDGATDIKVGCKAAVIAHNARLDVVCDAARAAAIAKQHAGYHALAGQRTRAWYPRAQTVRAAFADRVADGAEFSAIRL